MVRFFRKFNAVRKAQLGADSRVLFGKGVDIFQKKTSEIIVEKGTFQLGLPLPKNYPYATRDRTVLILEEGSKLICKGNVFIAPGSTIKIRAGATVIFDGGNHIAHDCTILCGRKIHFGQDASVSWNVNLIDDDGHFFVNSEGKRLRRFYKPLIIGKKAGLQMNVTVPSGVTIGDSAVVGANTVIRQDIPDRSLVYSTQKLEVKYGIQSPF